MIFSLLLPRRKKSKRTFLCKRRFSPNDDENFDDDDSNEKKKKKKKKKKEERGGGGGDALTNTSPFYSFLKKMKEIHVLCVKFFRKNNFTRSALARRTIYLSLRSLLCCCSLAFL